MRRIASSAAKNWLVVVATVAVVAALAVVAAVAGTARATTSKSPTLTVWMAQTEVAAAKTAFARYHQVTGTKINTVVIPDPYESNVLTKFAAGQHPDILFWQPTHGELGLINATKTLQTLDGEKYLKKEPKTITKYAGSIGKHTYAAIFGSPAIIGVWYNKQNFVKAGITSVPKNFAQFKAAAAKLKAAGITPLYDAGGDMWPDQWLVDLLMAEAWTKGGLAAKLNTNKATFSDPRFLNAVNQYQSMIKAGDYNSDIKTGTFNAQSDAVYNGTVGMIVQGPYSASYLQTKYTTPQIDARLGFFGLSGQGNSPSFVLDQTGAFVLPKTGNSTNEAAAKKFLRWFMGPHYKTYVRQSRAYPGLLGYKAPAGVPKSVIEANKENAANGLPLMQMVLAVIPDIHIYLSQMIAGALTPQGVADKMTQQFQQQAKAEHLPGF
jgi:raffinose/stachyose/melibiose transport system substrate-binding protein